jgi:hypothetical protein
MALQDFSGTCKRFCRDDQKKRRSLDRGLERLENGLNTIFKVSINYRSKTKTTNNFIPNNFRF